MTFPTQQYEKKLYAKGYNFIAGVDEAGRGAWAGPIVAGAVILPQDFFMKDIRDSKLLGAKKREFLCAEIKKIALSWAVGIVDIAYINQYNIGKANIKVFELVIGNLNIKPDYVMIDGVCGKDKDGGVSRRGHGKIPPNTPLRKLGITCEYIKDGDAKIYSIAAASIIAKVERDEILKKEHLLFPKYGFDKNKGYGTKFHQEALRKYGICESHRILYKPIKRVIELKNFMREMDKV